MGSDRRKPHDGEADDHQQTGGSEQGAVDDGRSMASRMRPNRKLAAMRVLVLEDDLGLQREYVRALRSDGHAVDAVRTLRAAREAVRRVVYDCLVLDRVVADGDTIDLVSELNVRPQQQPVVMLSATDEPEERIDGLAAGADDYMTAPVVVEELVLRVRKQLLRRNRPVPTPHPVRLGGVVVDMARQEVHIDGELRHLTAMQYSVLEVLVRHRGELVSGDELLDRCWQTPRANMGNPLYSQISRLRKIFGDHFAFESIRGSGYRLRVLKDEVPPPAPEQPGPRRRVVSDQPYVPPPELADDPPGDDIEFDEREPEPPPDPWWGGRWTANLPDPDFDVGPSVDPGPDADADEP